jgi:hypothetical protein
MQNVEVMMRERERHSLKSAWGRIYMRNYVWGEPGEDEQDGRGLG